MLWLCSYRAGLPHAAGPLLQQQYRDEHMLQHIYIYTAIYICICIYLYVAWTFRVYLAILVGFVSKLQQHHGDKDDDDCV